MNHQDKRNVILVGQNIESQIVFNNALSNLGLDLSIRYFFELDKAIKYLEEPHGVNPDMIFLETGKNDDCMDGIRQIRAMHLFDNLSIVLYDSGLQSLDNEAVFADGTNVYIHRNHDYIGLKKILKQLMRIDYQFYSGNMNRETYRRSL